SKELYERSCRVVPGGIHHHYRFYRPYPTYMQGGWGCRVRDVDGNDYIDVWSAHYAAILGHAPALLTEEMKAVVEGGTHYGIPSEREIRFAELLVEVLPGVEQVRFGVSGTEATMYAVRLARAYSRRGIILKAAGGWHGPNTDLCVAVSPPYDEPESAGLPPAPSGFGVKIIPFNDIEGTLKVIDEVGDDLAGVIVEPVQGAAFIPAERDYLLFLREETAARGAVLIFDEIICGFRLGLGGAREYYELTPDLSTYGKVAGGGFPLGLVAGREDVLALGSLAAPGGKSDRVLMGGGTYSCNPLSMVGGYLMVKYLRDNRREVYPYLASLGDKARAGLRRALDQAGLAAHVFGVGSLVSQVVLRGEITAPIRNVVDASREGYPEANSLFPLALLNEGVHNVRGKAAFSTAHTAADVDSFVEAAECAACAVVEDLAVSRAGR
ncbi:MAG: aminotransferase class III-fold pyridoxal phosphate-dependent enzyme, partial [Actinobacteria bacterium]|nr:aminotransferase class III-fold pyridoxal phosphate-dependent enzyme [Actinomycetota bacterium]